MDINIEILRSLSQGVEQSQISERLKKEEIKPNSVSIIDKRLKAMRKEFECKTVFQLMYKVGKLKLV